LDKTILILDEAKSIITQMESLQTNECDNVFGCWINFDNLIKPFVVMSISRTQAEVIHKHCQAACPEAVIKKYNSDSLAANHKDFNDVNEVWANVDIFIPQPSVPVAVLNSCILLVALDIFHQ